MRRRVDKEQLGEVVEFVGWSDAEGLRALLRESDGFLAPAVREAFGLAALEARAVGLPVVAMRESAIADFIGDGESGLLATSESDFSACVRRLVQDTSLRNAIATHNRSVRPDLTWDRSMSAHCRGVREGDRVSQVFVRELLSTATFGRPPDLARDRKRFGIATYGHLPYIAFDGRT